MCFDTIHLKSMESTNVKMSMLIRMICCSAFAKLQIRQEKGSYIVQSDLFVYAGRLRPRIRLDIYYNCDIFVNVSNYSGSLFKTFRLPSGMERLRNF